MKIGELADRIHVSRIHAWRLARAGVVPATKKTKGGHYYFVECDTLNKWINFTAIIGSHHRKKMMALAYKKNYGSEKIQCQKLARMQLKEFRISGNLSRKKFSRNKLVNSDVGDYYSFFHDSIVHLETVLDDWGDFSQKHNLPWPMEIKRAMQLRLSSLRKKLDDFMAT